MKIRYLKTKEVFELEVPDPLNPKQDTIFVKINDYDLLGLIKNHKVNNLDDDTKLGIKLLCEKYYLSVRVLKLAKRKQHLRKLNRLESSWVKINSRKQSKKREARSNVLDKERKKYLIDNFDEIAKNCIKHDWFDEFYRLCKDVKPDMKKKEIVRYWQELKFFS